MKKILFLLSILVFFLSSVKADHDAGAELTYKWVKDNGDGTSDYEITLAMYRDCGGQFYQNSYLINYNSSCNVTPQDLTLIAAGTAVPVRGYRETGSAPRHR